MIFGSKKSQMVVFVFLFLGFVLISINYMGTNNVYKKKDVYHNLYKNVQEETCALGKMSSSFEIRGNYDSWKSNVTRYCDLRGCFCNLRIDEVVGRPEPPFLNYTHFRYKINTSCGGSVFVVNFTC